MAKKKAWAHTVRPSVARPIIQSTVERPSRIKVVSGIERKERVCADWCALSAWHLGQHPHARGLNHGGLRSLFPRELLVVELVTAEIVVPFGEAARLRMNTTLGTRPSNLDLVLTLQGTPNGVAIWVCTHSLRAYSETMVEFWVNRDNPWTEGEAFVCVAGYLVTP
jgi:hypothetical protein